MRIEFSFIPFLADNFSNDAIWFIAFLIDTFLILIIFISTVRALQQSKHKHIQLISAYQISHKRPVLFGSTKPCWSLFQVALDTDNNYIIALLPHIVIYHLFPLSFLFLFIVNQFSD